LIWDGETYKRGAATLPTVTDKPPRSDGSGIVLAATTPDEKPVPTIAARAPGARGSDTVNDAALTAAAADESSKFPGTVVSSEVDIADNAVAAETERDVVDGRV
jgi:hypothetical protein